IHRLPALFPRPEVFDPGRWLPERAKDVTRGSYLPFGGGSRKCIGDVFGMTEATLALAALASRWRLRPVPGETLSPQAGVRLAAGRLTRVPGRRGARRARATGRAAAGIAVGDGEERRERRERGGKARWWPGSAAARFGEAVLQNEEVVSVNASTWV